MNSLSPIVVFDAVSLAASQNSRGIHSFFLDNIGVQFVWTGTPTGTFGMDVSNNATLNTDGTVSGGTWTPIVFTDPSPPAATGSSGNGYLELNQTTAAFVRVTYTKVSGTGACTAYLTGKPV